ADQDAYFDQSGLVDGGKVWTNAPLTEEDGIQPVEIDNLFDGDYTTQFHTAWQWASSERFDWHNLAVELPEPLSAVTLKYSKRTGSNQLGAPVLCHFYTTNDTTGYTNDDYSGWTDQGYLTFTYPYNLPEELGVEGTQENMVGIASIQFDGGQAWKYFRFDVEDNFGSNRNATTGNLYFNMGEFRVFKATYDPENSLLNQIPAELTQALLDEIAAARNQLANGDATQEQYDKLQEALDNFNEEYPDVAALREYIEEMKTLVEGAEEGSGIGYFAAGAQTEAENAINAAEAKVTDKMTAAQIKDVRAEIETAINTLNSKLVKPAGGTYYRIFSTSTSSGSQNGNYIYAAGSGETALRWNGSAADANLTDKLNSIWRAVAHGDGTYSFQNAFTGDYLNAAEKVNNDVKNGSASRLKLQFAGAAGSFELVSGEDVCINCDPSGKVVTYYTGDANAKFGFEPEANNSWSGDQVIEPTDELVVITLPFAVQYTAPDVYTVVGKNLETQTLELEIVSDEIPAGTPFVVKNPSTNVVYATPVATDFPQLVYAPEPLTVDGLVGVYAAKEIGPNYGVLYRGQLVKSYSGDVVGANTGYVDLANVPTVTTTGDLSVPIEDALIEVLTGVETITVTGNTVQNGIFDLQGRRVVKAQKGLYIINGKKVLVK
ncbi:MAG: RICIN domain-containing protein, partial [Alloprevotella sp.]|nr:RICIN domain-containing protein [Alloprevotella sp.]